MSAGLTMLVAWTWSKNFDKTFGGAGNSLNGGTQGAQNVYNLGSEYALSNIDAPHRISQAYTYDLPIGKGKQYGGSMNKIADIFVGGWSINTVGVIRSGFPLQIGQNNQNDIVLTSSQRPNASGSNPFLSGPLSQYTDGKAGSAYLSKSAFLAALALTFGNLSRTISTRTLRQVNWDMSLFKTFSVTERIQGYVPRRGFECADTPYFRNPGTNINSSSFGIINSQANFPRFIQLGFRAAF